MSNKLMYKLVTSLGYCCIWAFLRAKRRFNTRQISAYLGVDRRSIRRWKHEIRAGSCCCTNQPNCMKRDVVFSDERLESRAGDEAILRTPQKPQKR